MKEGWVVKPLGEIAEIIAGQSPEGSTYNRIGNGTPFYQGKKDFTDKFIGEPTNWTTNPNKIALAGDVLMSVRAPVGPINFATQTCCIGRGLAAIRFGSEIDKDFIFYCLLSKSKEISGKEGAVFASINKADIGKIHIPIPPINEQQRIVAKLDEAFEAIASAKEKAEQNLLNARALFDSYLDDVFSKRGEGWAEKKLEEIGVTRTGSTPKTSDRSNYGNHIPFVKPGDFNLDGSLEYENDGLSEKGAGIARLIPKNSVLMVCIGATIGKCGYNVKEIATNQQVNSLTPVRGACHRFIYYQMLTETFQRKVVAASGQATLPIINKTKWSALSLWMPQKIEDQLQLVTNLDALREQTQQLESLYQQKLNALDELKQSLLHQAFSGEL